MRVVAVAFACVVLVSCSPTRIQVPEAKGTLIAEVAASGATESALGVTSWRVYENADANRRVADGVNGSAIRVELDGSPAAFAYLGKSGQTVALDAQGQLTGNPALLTEAQQAGALFEADVRNQAASEPSSGPVVLVCDAEAAALADTIQRAATTCQASPGSQACKTAIHDIHLALHVLLDCILSQSGGASMGDGGVTGDGGIGTGDGGTGDGGMAACNDARMALFTGCSPANWGRQSGEPCWRAIQCKAVCCNCTGGTSWSAAACIDGHCADATSACACMHDLAPGVCQ